MAVVAGGLATFNGAPAAQAAALENRNPTAAGASLPISYGLSSLPGNKVFVAPNGSDNGDGSQSAPFKTLPKAVSVAGAGSTVVLRGGTYPIAGNEVSIAKKLTLIAYPGEVPVFDGSVPAPTATTAEGSLRSFAYTPMPARIGEGLSLTVLPQATFSGGAPTGLAASRGWKCVTGAATYSNPSGSGAGCPSGTPRVITGFYPDQVWVGGKPLVQVLQKSKVVPGTFFVERSANSDGNPGASRLYLSGTDAANMGQVRVSRSSGTFLIAAAPGVRIEGLRIVRHSPDWNNSAIRVAFAAHDVTVKNVELTDVDAIPLRIMGGDAPNQSQITRRTTIDKVTVHRGSWMGINATYTDDLRLLNVKVTNSNPDSEYVTAPKSGGLKASKTHRTKIIGSVFANNNSHGSWFDQSNYDTVVANSKFVGNSASGVFYEISHGLTMVNNLVVAGQPGASTPAVRLAGASGARLVNNTIVGTQTPLALAGDERSKNYTTGRPCAEHSERYRKGGAISKDCPPGLSSDLDMARPGAFGSQNLTPKLNWRPSATLLVNNVFANPAAGSGGICPGGYPVCIKGHAGSASNPTVVFKTNEMLAGATINGNVYQAPGTVAQIRVQTGGQGGVQATTLSQLRTTLGSSWYQLNAEANGLAGTGWVAANGAPTAALNARQGQAAPVPTDGTINVFVPAGSKRYGTNVAP